MQSSERGFMDSKTMKIFAPESELSVIAAFVSGEPPLDLFDLLSPDDFYDPHCRSWFSVITKLFEQNSAIAPDTIAAYLHSQGNANGDEPKLVDLSGRYVADPAYHAKIVKDFSLRRQYGKLAQRITSEVDKHTDSFEIGDIIQNELLSISGDMITALMPLGTTIEAVLDEAKRTAAGEITYPQTGINHLDLVLNGFRPGQLIIVAARPSVGKTALALSIARETAKAKVSTDYYSLEQDQRDMTSRLICMEGGFSTSKLSAMPDFMSGEIYGAVSRASALEPYLRIDDRIPENMASLRSRIRNNVLRHKTRIVIVDYLGLMNAPMDLPTKDLQVGYITRNLKIIAKDYKITIVLLCQLNRNVEARNTSKPVLSDLRDSGNIEQDADIVMFISRDKEADNGTATIHVAKNRNGKLQDVQVAFRSECMHFGNLAYDNIQPPVF